jgi:hypothetical protein
VLTTVRPLVATSAFVDTNPTGYEPRYVNRWPQALLVSGASKLAARVRLAVRFSAEPSIGPVLVSMNSDNDSVWPRSFCAARFFPVPPAHPKRHNALFLPTAIVCQQEADGAVQAVC